MLVKALKTEQLMKITRLIVVAMLLALAGGVASAQQSKRMKLRSLSLIGA